MSYKGTVRNGVVVLPPEVQSPGAPMICDTTFLIHLHGERERRIRGADCVIEVRFRARAF